MNYPKQFYKLKGMLNGSGNRNIIHDFLIQLREVRTLNNNILQDYINDRPVQVPSWIEKVNQYDIHNVVVFIMWKEFQTVIDTYQENSNIGTKIEDLANILETIYYVKQMINIHNDEPRSYTEWVRYGIETHGIERTVKSVRILLDTSHLRL
jgi:hypothetical protein